MKIKRALLSVYEKSGVVELAAFLASQDIEIIATGNTYKVLLQAGVKAIEVADYTGYPEIMEGRVKTLHPKIHGGILSNRTSHNLDMEKLDITNIDLVVANLYPFSRTARNPNSSEEQIIEQIDIGGVALLRAAAKNFRFVTVIASPGEYQDFMKRMAADEVNLLYRKRLAAQAFFFTTEYDAGVYRWLMVDGIEPSNGLPDHFLLTGKKVQDLRCGENPHQRASFYSNEYDQYPLKQLSGKELSYNNIMDVESAIVIAGEFSDPVAVIVKHNNPCGVAVSNDILMAYQRSLACDPQSSFGGIIALNRVINADLAQELNKIFLEVVVAPQVTPDALEILKTKKNLRVVLTGDYKHVKKYDLRCFSGGFLLQDVNSSTVSSSDLTLVTKSVPTAQEELDMLFAWKVCKHVKSNAIVLVKDGQTIGIGAGQMSRVDSLKIAIQKAQGHDLKGAVLASDAFFPFADSIKLAAQAGIKAIIQTGGSIRDQEVIESANSNQIAMVFTKTRNFCH